MRAAVSSSSARQGGRLRRPRPGRRGCRPPARARRDRSSAPGSAPAAGVRPRRRWPAASPSTTPSRSIGPSADDQLDQPPQGAVHRPHPLDGRHLTVADAQDRLDAQQRAGQRRGAADAAAALQELEVSTQSQDAQASARFFEPVDDLGCAAAPAAASVAAISASQPRHTETDAGVDDRDALGVDRFGGACGRPRTCR